MGLVELDPQIVPNLKVGLHSFQIILAFVLWCLEIVVFKGKDSQVVGLNGWTFAVCFLSIPAWIYLIMTPRFERTRRFANPYVMFGVDAVFVVLWLSAFATQASYNTANLCGDACGSSKGIVGLGILITLLWGGSTFVSAFTMTYYKFNSSLPGYDSHKIGGDNIDPDKAAFSMAPHDEEAYERVHMNDHDDHDDHESHTGSNNHYGDGNPYSADDYDNSSSSRYGAGPPRINTPLFDSDTGYGGSSLGIGGGHRTPSPGGYRPEPYDDGPVHFPSGNYDRIQH